MDYRKALQFLEQFHYIYEKGIEINPIPKGKVVAVYMMNFDLEFIIESTTLEDLGREKLIARKWILQEELEKLMNQETEFMKDFKPNLIPNNPKGEEGCHLTPIAKNGGHKMYLSIKKKDGCRLELIEGKVLSRSLKVPGSYLVVDRFKALAEQLHALGIVAEGEFYMHGLKFNAIFRFFSKSDVTTPEYKKELEKALQKDPKAFAKEYDGHSIEFLTTFHADLKFHLFDGILTDAPGLTRYQDRMVEIRHRLEKSGLIGNPYLVLPHIYKTACEEDLQNLYEMALSEGYEGLVLTHVGHEYKYGRNSLSQGTLLKMKDDALEYDGVVIDVEEATSVKDGIETTINELGRSVTSKKKDDRESSGLAKGFRVLYSDKNGQGVGTFTVGLKGFDNDAKRELLENKGKYIGKHFKYTGMAPVKDFPRHAYFQCWRDEK